MAWYRFGARLAKIFIGRPVALRICTVRILRIITGKQFLIENGTAATEKAALSFVRITNAINTAAEIEKIKESIIIYLFSFVFYSTDPVSSSA